MDVAQRIMRLVALLFFRILFRWLRISFGAIGFVLVGCGGEGSSVSVETPAEAPQETVIETSESVEYILVRTEPSAGAETKEVLESPSFVLILDGR